MIPDSELASVISEIPLVGILQAVEVTFVARAISVVWVILVTVHTEVCALNFFSSLRVIMIVSLI